MGSRYRFDYLKQSLLERKPVEGRDSEGRVAVMTSGGDSQGMNAAIRAIVRTCLHYKMIPYGIMEGYNGLVEENSNLMVSLTSGDVSGILQSGGTILGTARSPLFRTEAGRRTAVYNLAKKGITHLMVVGGDGSLTGAEVLRQEWKEHVSYLQAEGKLDKEDGNYLLKIVGLVGSIDNDLVGLDMTIGADTALTRIVESVDNIISTATSHQRCFVIQCMGRNCGWLTLMAGITTGCDFILIPELPLSLQWREKVLLKLQAGRKAGRRALIVLVSEGAKDVEGNEITGQMVKEALASEFDTRLTILGHIQRGGSPTVYDRVMSSLLGVQAVKEVMEPSFEESVIIGIRGERICTLPLASTIANAREASKGGTSIEMRGNAFQRALEGFLTFSRCQPKVKAGGEGHVVLLMHMGAGAPGMNYAVRAAVRLLMSRGHRVLVALDGMEGLLAEDVVAMDWDTVNGWTSSGGSMLGTSRRKMKAGEADRMVEILDKHNVSGMMLIGGWECLDLFSAISTLPSDHRLHSIPITHVPATISNNIPLCDYSLGSDTALNNIIASVDKMKSSAQANRLFVVEVMGSRCGYLATMSGFACGAELVYTHEVGVSLAGLAVDSEQMKERFSGRKGQRLKMVNVKRRIALAVVGQCASDAYTTKTIARILEEEGKGVFSVRSAVLAHTQQGGNPSARDRLLAHGLVSHGCDWLCESLAAGRGGCMTVVRRGNEEKAVGFGEMKGAMDEKNRRPANPRYHMDTRSLFEGSLKWI